VCQWSLRPDVLPSGRSLHRDWTDARRRRPGQCSRRARARTAACAPVRAPSSGGTAGHSRARPAGGSGAPTASGGPATSSHRAVNCRATSSARAACRTGELAPRLPRTRRRRTCATAWCGAPACNRPAARRRNVARAGSAGAPASGQTPRSPARCQPGSLAGPPPGVRCVRDARSDRELPPAVMYW